MKILLFKLLLLTNSVNYTTYTDSALGYSIDINENYKINGWSLYFESIYTRNIDIISTSDSNSVYTMRISYRKLKEGQKLTPINSTTLEKHVSSYSKVCACEIVDYWLGTLHDGNAIYIIQKREDNAFPIGMEVLFNKEKNLIFQVQFLSDELMFGVYKTEFLHSLNSLVIHRDK